MSDTWNELNELKSKKLSLREKLARRKKEREGIIGETLGEIEDKKPDLKGLDTASQSPSPAPPEIKQEIKVEKIKVDPELLKEIEQQLLLTIDDATIELPIDTEELLNIVTKNNPIEGITLSIVDDLVQKFTASMLLTSTVKIQKTGKSSLIIESIDHTKVSALTDALDVRTPQNDRKRKVDSKEDDEVHEKVIAKHPKREDLQKKDDLIESLLSTRSAKQQETSKVNEEIMELLSKPSAMELSLVEKFKSQGGTSLKEFCPHGTRQECNRIEGKKPCGRLHFKKIIHKHTDESLGDCSFLNTCFHMDTCKYVHYEVDYPDTSENPMDDKSVAKPMASSGSNTTLYPPQWVQCDMRYFDMSVLGKFSVVMADPPWDIHMELPYGTMSDDEMRKLGVPILQDDGYIFLWVTGRYERVDELIWVKTNQLQRIIRTGRTGHWFNHGKEHCLVGMKGNPANVNRGLDCDILVAEVRATSHKPDEIYGIIERLSPGSRKIELFGRPHNVNPNWITLGNQADGVKLVDPEVALAFNKKYPNPKMALLSEEKGLQYLRTGTID